MVSVPRLSILMPTHTRVDVIGIAIESVLSQTFGDFELLVVGDGCVPGTADVVAGFKDKRIRFFDLPKAPYFGYANRNIALREARGELIGFAADDDILLPDHFELLSQCLEDGAVIAHSQALWVSTDGIAAPFLTNLEIPDELEHFMERYNTIPASCFLYRANSLPSLDAWPEDVPTAADWRLWHRIIRENPQSAVIHCRQPTLLHFSAKWKNSRNSGMDQLSAFLDMADNSNWWPSELRVQTAEGQVEQQAYAALLRADPQRWIAGIRRAAHDLTVRVAWTDLQFLRPQLKASKDQITAVSAELESTRSERASAFLRAGLFENELVLAKEELKATQADQKALSDLLDDSLADLERLTSEVQRMQASLGWRLHQAVTRFRRR
ncbi:Spore coat polysaccharide biosynthesis protein SpsA [Ensifer adhaerens]|uniref:glycosyltransferase family 2 protein n=1 Tax=Ensifer adhaerens TaxID=106592 RepID=UPI00249DA95C|nr:glycosyltransferase family 2 protein [Ensifer adhaerens]NRP21082.1 Spore coat polysaccharide biosynthesis protein SpsA [Ensifer adhaerens]